jgi:hypothetical protein
LIASHSPHFRLNLRDSACHCLQGNLLWLVFIWHYDDVLYDL